MELIKLSQRRCAVFLLGCLALFACDDGSEATSEDLVIEASSVELSRLVVRIKRDRSADVGPRGREITETSIDVEAGTFPLLITDRLLPAGEGRIYVHVVGYMGDTVAAIGDGSAAPGEAQTIIPQPYNPACDADGDTFLDCQNLRLACCESLANRDQVAFNDCHDDQAEISAKPDRKVRSAQAANPFAPVEDPDDYATCGNSVDEDCEGGDQACSALDADEDGYDVSEDCDDANPGINPGVAEIPGNEVDENCDNSLGGAADADRDGFAVDDPDPARRDCDDNNPRINPGVAEVPCNGLDDDCSNGDRCVMGYLDGDGVELPEDCDAFDSSVYPGAEERCGDGIDQDCDGSDLACDPNDRDGDGRLGDEDCDETNPRRFVGAPDKCGDGIDQNCDGVDLECEDILDEDGDGYSTPDDCNDAVMEINPEAVEACDRVDNDCDGLIDEGNPRLGTDGRTRDETCSTDEGTCSLGPLVCTATEDDANRAEFVCLGVSGTEEVCDSFDNDCDGQIDNAPPGRQSLPDEGVDPCGPETEEGQCRRGALFCDENGQLLRCEGAVFPTAELCNELDDDCDGRVDEGPGGGTLSEGCFDGESEIVGACREGVRRCVDGEFTACEGQIQPTPEMCDGTDNDCDGLTDEVGALTCYTGPPELEGVGVCVSGNRACQNDGALGDCIGAVLPSDEVCDGLDNDCDGRIDQFTEDCFSGTPEQLGVGLCRGGQWTCEDSVFSPCSDVPPADEICDDLDNDCDGDTDEDFDLNTDPAHCGRCNNVCAGGQACCNGACRPLDTTANCGECGDVCGDEADACTNGQCTCNGGAACEGNLRCLADGCGCEADQDCGDNQLCCGNACVDTALGRCETCEGGNCDPTKADGCTNRGCSCGGLQACVGNIVCVNGQCVGCADNGDCNDDSICCGEVCVPTNIESQCEECGQACAHRKANQCVANGEDRACQCGNRAPCGAHRYCVVGDNGAACVECADDADCPGARPHCLDNVCRACDPNDQSTCDGNSLCCDFECVEGDPDGSCTDCDVGCDEIAADTCLGRTCKCGNHNQCSGATPICEDGTCVECRAGNNTNQMSPDCAGNGDGNFCVNHECVACLVGNHNGCTGEELCCESGGEPVCQSTGPAAGQCTACNVDCSRAADGCGMRTCECGGGPACAGGQICFGGDCVDCLDDSDCNGNASGNQCVDHQCEACDPDGHVGCGANQLCCGAAGSFACRAGELGDRGCEACGVACADGADRCTARTCKCGGVEPCEGDTPLCNGAECVECLGDNDCGNDSLCCQGVCEATDPDVQCTACTNRCDPLRADRCVNRSCGCGDGPVCGADEFCVGGDCVDCVANGNCPAGQNCDSNGACVACGADCGCENGDDCPADRPFCEGGHCVSCQDNGDCADPTEPICGDAFACQACSADQECVGVGVGPYCSTAGDLSGACLRCDPADDGGCRGDLLRSDCRGSGVDSVQCRKCQNNTQCENSIWGPTCRLVGGDGGGCQCAADADCGNGKAGPACIAGRCGCNEDNDCAGHPLGPVCSGNPPRCGQ